MLSRVRTRQSAHSNRTSAHSKRIIKQNVFADLVQLADSDCDCEDAVDSSDDEYTPPVKRVCRLGERRPPTKHEMDTEQHQVRIFPIYLKAGQTQLWCIAFVLCCSLEESQQERTRRPVVCRCGQTLRGWLQRCCYF